MKSLSVLTLSLFALAPCLGVSQYSYKPKKLLVDSSSNVYVISEGVLNTDPTFTITNVCKYTSTGTSVWEYDYLPDISSPTCAAFDSSGNIIVGGTTKSAKDYLLVKINTSGVQQWARTVNKNQEETVRDLICGASGTIYFVGTSTDNSSVYNSHFLKYSSSGTLAFTKTNSSGQAFWWSLTQDTSGNPIFAGYEYNPTTFTPSTKAYKYNTSGALQSTFTNPTFAYDVKVAVDANNKVCLWAIDSNYWSSSSLLVWKFNAGGLTGGWAKSVSSSLIAPKLSTTITSTNNLTYALSDGSATYIGEHTDAAGTHIWLPDYLQPMLNLHSDTSGNRYITAVSPTAWYGQISPLDVLSTFTTAVSSFRNPTTSLVAPSGQVYVGSSNTGGSYAWAFLIEAPGFTVYGPPSGP